MCCAGIQGDLKLAGRGPSWWPRRLQVAMATSRVGERSGSGRSPWLKAARGRRGLRAEYVIRCGLSWACAAGNPAGLKLAETCFFGEATYRGTEHTQGSPHRSRIPSTELPVGQNDFALHGEDRAAPAGGVEIPEEHVLEAQWRESPMSGVISAVSRGSFRGDRQGDLELVCAVDGGTRIVRSFVTPGCLWRRPRSSGRLHPPERLLRDHGPRQIESPGGHVRCFILLPAQTAQILR